MLDVYLQSIESIKGHFLICYVAVLLERILQFKIFENKYSSSELYNFFKSYKVIKGKNEYTNITNDYNFIKEITKFINLPLRNLYLTKAQYERILNYKL